MTFIQWMDGLWSYRPGRLRKRPSIPAVLTDAEELCWQQQLQGNCCESVVAIPSKAMYLQCWWLWLFSKQTGKYGAPIDFTQLLRVLASPGVLLDLHHKMMRESSWEGISIAVRLEEMHSPWNSGNRCEECSCVQRSEAVSKLQV